MTTQESLKEVVTELADLLEFHEVEIENCGIRFSLGKAFVEIGPEDNFIDTLRAFLE